MAQENESPQLPQEPLLDEEPAVSEEAASRRNPRKKIFRNTVIALLITIVLVLIPTFVTWVASAGRTSTIAEVGPHDVAMVFGAGLWGDRPTPYLEARLTIARDLYRAGKVKVILVTGDNLTEFHNEPEVMKNWLVGQGIPADKIVTDHAGEDTYSSCVRAKKIFGVDSAILVSQSYHLPRAISTCRFVGVDAVGVGDPYASNYDGIKWVRYSLREVPASVKMLMDVTTRRTPILGDYESGIDDALGG
ncbi:MAG: YdcF family protein [Propionibacteriaceae bacterium]|nr:YdcF family protein [Propionibacteriaceae bacterium]